MKSIQLTKKLITVFEEDPAICKQYTTNYIAQCRFNLANCYFELGKRELSIANLKSIKKLISSHPCPVLKENYSLVKALHEHYFEDKYVSVEDWTEMFQNSFKHAEIDFCIDHFQRLLNRYQEEEKSEYPPLRMLFQKMISSTEKSLPTELRNDFKSHYTFEDSLHFNASANYYLHQFIDMSRKLLSERTIENLAHKSLEFLFTYGKFDRGFVTFKQAGNYEIIAHNNISCLNR